MLEIKNVKKKYVTGELVQTALDDVSLNLRDNEFVAILGQSGSGKTTLLNVIGGLDRYDDGDLVINGVSTKKYTDRDWDTYRNHTIGFVFQSYNLISHQSILSNVELALTLSGIGRVERRRRAKEALQKVGLGDQIHKKPNQLSGGQMQRVAIARALVNNPRVLLADEPTGALDSETGLQVMELLKEVAGDRLVVMVTHNPELAEAYANRIVRLKDGKIVSDSNPYDVKIEKTAKTTAPVSQTTVKDGTRVVDNEKRKGTGKDKKAVKKKKSSMSPLTALALSFDNLKKKKGRTVLTSVAGSIGIIGIALILAMSNGVNTYIAQLQKDTMTSYPLTINAQTIDTSSAVSDMVGVRDDILGGNENQAGAVYTNNSSLKVSKAMTSNVIKNNLTAFKSYIENPDSEIREYIGENGVVYSYDLKFNVYAYDGDGNIVDTSRDVGSAANNTVNKLYEKMFSMLGMQKSATSNFSQMIPGQNGNLVSAVTTDSYEILDGNFPTKYNEVMLVLGSDYSIDTSVMYQLGLISAAQYNEIVDAINNNREAPTISLSYETVLNHRFYLVPFCDYYKADGDGTFSYVGDAAKAAQNGIELKISGIIKPKDGANNASITTAVAYTGALTDYIIDRTDESAVVKAQMADPEINVLTGISFASATDEEKIAAMKSYFDGLGESEKAALFDAFIEQNGMYASMIEGMIGKSIKDMTETEKAVMFVSMLSLMSDEQYVAYYDEMMSSGSYEDNLAAFGKISRDAPSSISIYADSFEAKEGISAAIAAYNANAKEGDVIVYTDYVALLTSSITQIVDIISYVLIAFVAVSLVVSCIMIAIITNISVLERTKEIGILRSIGASKGNISFVFVAETIIIGFLSGLIGVVVSALLTIPINAIIAALAGARVVEANLSLLNAIILVAIAVAITVFGGLIPASNAAKKDPVLALRSE